MIYRRKMFPFRYVIVNILKKIINSNNNKSVRYYKPADATPRKPITETAQEHKECQCSSTTQL